MSMTAAGRWQQWRSGARRYVSPSLQRRHIRIMASQITGNSTVCPDVHQRKQRSAFLAPLWGESTGDRSIPRTNGQQAEKFSFHDVIIMISCLCSDVRWQWHATWWRYGYGHTFRVIGPFYGESIGYRWILSTKSQLCAALMVLLLLTWKNLEQTVERSVKWDDVTIIWRVTLIT